MRKAEITLLTILYFIITTLGGAYIEESYGITVSIDKALDINNTKEKEYPDIIITDKDK